MRTAVDSSVLLDVLSDEKKQVMVPDFLIGAHAQIHSDRLLARDRGYLRDYFTKLKVWIP